MTYYVTVEGKFIAGVSPDPRDGDVIEVSNEVGSSIIDNPRLLMEYVVVGNKRTGRQLILRSELMRVAYGPTCLHPLTRSQTTSSDCSLFVTTSADTVSLDPRTLVEYPGLIVYVTDETGMVCVSCVTYDSSTLHPLLLSNNVQFFSNYPISTFNIHNI